MNCPFHPKLAKDLPNHRPADVKGGEAVFKMPPHPEEPLYARIKKTGIQRMDKLGKKLDFHSPRYTFATALAINVTS